MACAHIRYFQRLETYGCTHIVDVIKFTFKHENSSKISMHLLICTLYIRHLHGQDLIENIARCIALQTGVVLKRAV